MARKGLLRVNNRSYFRFAFFLAGAFFTFAEGFLAGFALRDFAAGFGLTRFAADFLAGFFAGFFPTRLTVLFTAFFAFGLATFGDADFWILDVTSAGLDF